MKARGWDLVPEVEAANEVAGAIVGGEPGREEASFEPEAEMSEEESPDCPSTSSSARAATSSREARNRNLFINYIGPFSNRINKMLFNWILPQ
jgi:hypothetical protein